MKDNLENLAKKERDNSSTSKRVIDMDIIDRIKSMRSKSRDNNQYTGITEQQKSHNQEKVFW